jgi:hypothetical protein
MFGFKGYFDEVGWSFLCTPARCTTTGSTLDEGLFTLVTRVRNTDYVNTLLCDDSAVTPTL